MKIYNPTGFSSSLTGSFSGSVKGTLTATGNIIPDVSGAYDIGSTEFPFKDLYITQNSLKFINDSTGEEIGRISVNSNTGDIKLLNTKNLTEEEKANLTAENVGAEALSPVSASAIWVSQSISPGHTNTSIGHTNQKFHTVHTQYVSASSTSISGDLTVGGKVTAQEFHTEFVSASIIYQSGSTQFGNSADDIHSFTGSVLISGSIDSDLVKISDSKSSIRIHGPIENSNHFIGSAVTGQSLTSGARNIGIGYGTLREVTTGTDNIAFGYYTAFNINGSNNIAIGGSSLGNAGNGNNNIGIGFATFGNIGASTANGANRIGIGYAAGGNAPGANGIYIGYQAGNNIYSGTGNVVLGGNNGSTISGTNNNVILADGVGNIKAQFDSSGNAFFPNGNVGIGTTSPAKMLEILYPSYINKDTSEGLLRLVGQSNTENAGNALSAGTAIEFYNKWEGGNPYSVARISGRGSQTYDGGLQFDVSQNTGAGQTNFVNAITILKNTDVGIGTTLPDARLHVNGQTALGPGTQALDAKGYLTVRVGDDYAGIDIKSARLSGNIGGLRWSEGNGTIVGQLNTIVDGTFNYYNDLLNSYAFRVDGATNNFGIGTTSPQTPLHVTGNGSYNTYRGVLRILNTSSAQWAGLSFPDSTGTDSPANNYYFIGRGNAISDRIFSLHLPTAANYGSGNQPKFGIYSTGADGLFFVEAVTGDTYIKGDLGFSNLNPSVSLDLTNRTDGINLPKGTTAQRPTPTTGTMRFNTSVSGLEFYDGSAWNVLKPDTSVGTVSSPATTAAEIYTATNGTAADGVYYYTNGGQTYQAYTKFNWIESGHWVLALKVHNRGDMTSGNALWRNTTLSNETDFNLTSGTMSKYASYVYHPFTRILMDMNGTYPAVMIWNSLQTSIQAITNANPGGNLTGYACDATNPAIGNSRRYDSAGFYIQGGPFSVQTGFEPIVQEYGISCFANSSSNSTTDNTGLSALGYAGAYIGCPLDEGGHTFNNTSNAGADSGFGFGGGAGNEARTWSAGYGEWQTAAVVNTLPGYIWIR